MITNLDQSVPGHIAYQKLLSSLVAERDISGQKVSHILLDCSLVCTSRQYRSLPVLPDISGELDFGASRINNKIGWLQKYLHCSTTIQEELVSVSLLEFVTHCNARPDGTFHHHGGRGAKPYIVGIWPHYHGDPEDENQYENYCSTKMILHHPISGLDSDGKPGSVDSLLFPYASWKDAYHAKCLSQNHAHIDDTLSLRAEPEPPEDDTDTESISDGGELEGQIIDQPG